MKFVLQLDDVHWETIRRCTSGREGQDLLAAAGRDTHALRPKVSFIPTIVIDGSQDNQKGILKNFTRELCRAYKVGVGVRPYL